MQFCQRKLENSCHHVQFDLALSSPPLYGQLTVPSGQSRFGAHVMRWRAAIVAPGCQLHAGEKELCFLNAFASAVTITRVHTASDIATCHDLRRKVFVDELGVSAAVEFDEHDKDTQKSGAEHFLARSEQGNAIGACRLRPLKQGLGHKLERMCVISTARGAGIGSKIVKAVVNTCATREGPLFCHAKRDSARFYEHIGWSQEGLPFEEAGVPHMAFVYRQPPLGVSNVQGMGHVSLRTHDIERARTFYRIMGFCDEARFIRSGCRIAWIKVS